MKRDVTVTVSGVRKAGALVETLLTAALGALAP